MKFDSYHPLINFIYFVSVITCTICFKHPVFLGISFFIAFVYSVKLGGRKVLYFNIGMTAAVCVYAAWYASYEHFGMTVFGYNSIGNPITLESMIYGMTVGLIGSTAAMWFVCVFQLITSDKIIYLLGRVSPKLSLFFSILLRFIPRTKIRAEKIEISRAGIGKGMSQGTIWKRMLNICSLISILITWTLEEFVESANAMKSRGYSLKGRKAFSIYRFDQRDKSLLTLFLLGIAMIIAGWRLGEMSIFFDPVIQIHPISKISWLFYAAYAAFLALPLVLQIYGEYRFKKCLSKSFLQKIQTEI